LHKYLGILLALFVREQSAVACEPNLAFIFDLDRGSSFEELESAPEFADPSARNSIAANTPTF
jgi:hypothetical protein